MTAPSFDRLLWVLQHPTPYNIYLLNELVDRLPVRIEAVFRFQQLENHPWQSLPLMRFPWRLVSPAGGMDWQLVADAAVDPLKLVIFGGWRDRTIFPALVRRVAAGLPYAFWTDTPKLPSGIARAIADGLFVRAADRALVTLATGTPAVERYTEMGVPAQKLANFPFVVDPVHFAQSQLHDTASDEVRLLQVGRLINRLKGQRVAIDAVAHVTAVGKRVHLTIAGTGPERDALKAYARERGVDDRVRLLGWADYDAMPSLFAAHHALVMPSYWDPFPVAVIEALTAGLPVLGSSACGSVQERVRSGWNGFVHVPGDARELAGHIEQLFDVDRRRTLANNAGEDARRWGIERTTAVLSAVLRRVAK